MKKLSLNKMKLETGDMLQREQLKTVFGGYHSWNPDDPCIEKGNLCNGHSTNSKNLCCPGLKCDVSSINIGICVEV